MVWQAIANGANGVIQYCFGTMRDRMSKDEFAEAWREQCEIGAEVTKFIPVLLAEPAPNATGYPAGVSGRAWLHDGATYLLVVNETREAKSVSLMLPDTFGSAKAMLDESYPKLQGRKVAFILKPIGATMLCFKR